jgi:hypothetical protein
MCRGDARRSRARSRRRARAPRCPARTTPRLANRLTAHPLSLASFSEPGDHDGARASPASRTPEDGTQADDAHAEGRRVGYATRAEPPGSRRSRGPSPRVCQRRRHGRLRLVGAREDTPRQHQRVNETQRVLADSGTERQRRHLDTRRQNRSPRRDQAVHPGPLGTPPRMSPRSPHAAAAYTRRLTTRHPRWYLCPLRRT